MARIAKSELLSRLEGAGTEFAEIAIADGGSAVVTTRGARILGLFPGAADDATNALWTNPHLDGLLRGQLRDWDGEGMGSTGGERLWIAPERSFYYYHPETFADWFCPAGMDPGHYRLSNHDEPEVVFENIFDLEDIRNWRVYRNVRMERRFEALANPFRRDRKVKAILSNVQYVGIRKTDSIEVPYAPSDTRINLWTLALLDPGPVGSVGTVVIPVRPETPAIDYFGGLTKQRLIVHSDHVAFRIDSQAVGKVGVRPEDLALVRRAQIAAFLPTTDKDSLLLVIQRSLDIPHNQSECLDEAKANPDGPKGAVQAYNNGPGADPNSPYKRFGEIEIQMIAASQTPDKRRMAVTAVSDLLAFEGSREDILALGRGVLGVKEISLFA